MCVIIYLPKGKPVTNETLKKCFKANPDSVGYMFIKSGRIQVNKYLTFKPFLKDFRRDLKIHGDERDFVIHFRIATSGKVDLDNCHPFQIDSSHAFVHNGVISGYGSGVCSDTNEFSTLILAGLARSFPAFMQSDAAMELIQGYIGTYNKMVFLRKDGRVWILNSKQGEWVDGVWFSNVYWRHSYQYQVASGYMGYGRPGWGGDDGYGEIPSTPTTVTETFPSAPGANKKFLPAALQNLPEVECRECSQPTIHQDKLCNDCWKLEKKGR